MKNSLFPLAVMGLVLLNTGGAGNSAAPSFASTVSAGQASQALPVPERGFISSEPAEISTMTVKRGEAAVQNASDSKSRRLSLPAGREIQIELILK